MKNPLRSTLTLAILPFLAALTFLLASETDEENEAGAFENKRVLFIGIDGLRSDALQVAETPNLDALIASGAVTYNAIAGGELGTATQQVTSSGPGWASILTGVWTDKHGITDNSFVGSDLANYPHFFKRVKEANADACTASIIEWTPLDSAVVGPVSNFTDFRRTASGTQNIVNQATNYLAAADPDVLMLHFNEPDSTGHAIGFSPGVPAYLEAIAGIDTAVGEIIAALEARPNYDNEDWLVVVTTDHGGIGRSHGGQTAVERAIPMIVSGGEVSNRVISDGPGMTAVPPTIFKHLGIPVDPAWGWESEPFGYAPFCIDGLACVTDPVNESVTLNWNAPEEIDATGIKIERSGIEIADLPLDATTFTDSPDVSAEGFTTITYTVRTYGGTEGDDCPAQSCMAEFFNGDLSSELVLHLNLNDDASDSSGQGNDGSTTGAVEFLEGGLGGYTKFDANGEFISLGSPADLDFGTTTDFTVSMLVRSDRTFTTDNVIASNKNWASGRNPGWVIAVNTDGSWQWNIGDGSDRLDYDSPGGLINDDAWHHLTIVHDRDGLVQIYFDGELVSEQSMAAIGNIDALATALATDGTLAYPTFPGCLDELRIWRRKLTSAEVTELDQGFVLKTCPSNLNGVQNIEGGIDLTWNAGANLDATGFEILRGASSLATLPIGSTSYTDSQVADGMLVYTLRVLGNDAATCPDLTFAINAGGSPLGDLVLHLKLEGDATDSSGQGNNGTLSGTPNTVSGLSRNALDFTDTADPHQYVNLGTPTDLNFGSETDFTVSVWVNNSAGFPDNRGSGGSAVDPAIISNKDWNSGVNPGWFIGADGNGRWQWNLGDGSARRDYDGPADQINDGKWHHLLVSHDRDGNATLFYDGQQVSTVDISSIGNLNSGLPTAVATDGTLGTVWPNWFNGSIDNVKIWRRALSPVEALSNYTQDGAYFRWNEENFTSAQLANSQISGPGADPDTDGVSNLLEFAANQNPFSPTLPGLYLKLENGMLHYRRRQGGFISPSGYEVDGLVYSVETSPALSETPWQFFNFAQPAATERNDDATETASFPLALDQLHRFFRLKVTRD